MPSGIWHPDEYEKLRRYDADMADQPQAVFHCHQGSGEVCAGWLGHRDPSDLLAVRVGIIEGRLAPGCADYRTKVPLFASGAEAADHGVRDIRTPDSPAVAAIEKIVAVRAAAGDPVILEDHSIDAHIRQTLERKSRRLRGTASAVTGERRGHGD